MRFDLRMRPSKQGTFPHTQHQQNISDRTFPCVQAPPDALRLAHAAVAAARVAWRRLLARAHALLAVCHLQRAESSPIAALASMRQLTDIAALASASIQMPVILPRSEVRSATATMVDRLATFVEGICRALRESEGRGWTTQLVN